MRIVRQVAGIDGALHIHRGLSIPERPQMEYHKDDK